MNMNYLKRLKKKSRSCHYFTEIVKVLIDPMNDSQFLLMANSFRISIILKNKKFRGTLFPTQHDLLFHSPNMIENKSIKKIEKRLTMPYVLGKHEK